MLKKIKRYLDNLSYKETKRLILVICLAVDLLVVLFVIFNRNNFSGEFVTTFAIVFYSTLILGSILYIALNCAGKKTDERIKVEKQEFENLFTNSNNTAKLIVSESTEYFPKDIVLFYLEQKGTQFWIETENSEKSNEISAKIYITDKDNPGEKIVYPDTITNPLYVKSHFKFEK